MMHKTIRSIKISILFLLIFSTASSHAIGYFDWQSSIDRSCNGTISGKAKGIFSKYGFWFDTAVSMDMWAQFTRDDPPQVHCQINYSVDKDPIRYGRCMAYIQDKWDWYNRCRPIVNMLSKQEGRK